MTEKATKESGLQRHIGIEKYGKKGFEELQKAGREGASEEEKGAIKDKYLPKKESEDLEEFKTKRHSQMNTGPSKDKYTGRLKPYKPRGAMCAIGYVYDRRRGICVPKDQAHTIRKPDFGESTVREGLADLADMAERDHEVQMARSDLYKIAKYAIKLHEMMKNVSEAEGIEGWQQAKITKAADYLGSVYHALDYDTKFESVQVPEDAKPKQHKRVLSDSEVKSYKGSLASKLAEAKGVCPDCGKPSWRTLDETEKKKGKDGKVCWQGFRYAGTEDGKDKCVPTGR